MLVCPKQHSKASLQRGVDKGGGEEEEGETNREVERAGNIEE